MKTNLPYRATLLIIGLILLSFGVTLSIHSQLGTSPISSIPYAFSYFIPLTVGMITILMHCIFIILQMLILGKQFKWLQWSQIILGILFGFLIDAMLYLTQSWHFESYMIQMLISLTSCLFTAIGIIFMVKAYLFYLAAEGLYQACVLKFGIELGRCKTIGDCILVMIAALGSYVALNEIIGIREGTIITALLVGTLIRLLKPFFHFLDPKKLKTAL